MGGSFDGILLRVDLDFAISPPGNMREVSIRIVSSACATALASLCCHACGSMTTPAGYTVIEGVGGHDDEHGVISRRHDEFRNEDVLLLGYDLPGRLDMEFLTVIPHELFNLSFSGVFREWTYLRCHSVDAVVDGRPLPLPEFHHDGRVLGRSVSEDISAHLPLELVEQMAGGRSLRFRVCNDVIGFDQEQIDSLRTLLAQRRNAIGGSIASGRVSNGGTSSTSPVGAGCSLPVEAVVVCQSSQGYLFAIPAPGRCAMGAQAVRTISLTCADLSRPAYHACLEGTSGWRPARSWETCASLGLEDAPGDFVPPGRTRSQGVAPDQPNAERPGPRLLRCYSAAGLVVPTEAATCSAAGLSDTPANAGTAPTTPLPSVPVAPVVPAVAAEPTLPAASAAAVASPPDASSVPAVQDEATTRRHHHHRHRR